MSLLETLLKAKGGGLVGAMAQNLGMSQEQATGAVRSMAPALSRGLSRNAKQPGGFDALMGALQKGNHGRYMDDPGLLGQAESIADGNAILGHIFGSKDVSRNVADNAAQATGLDTGALKKMLPMLAAASMGSMGKQSSGGGALAGLFGSGGGGASAGMAGVLEGFLDADQDGAVVDDLLSMAKKFF